MKNSQSQSQSQEALIAAASAAGEAFGAGLSASETVALATEVMQDSITALKGVKIGNAGAKKGCCAVANAFVAALKEAKPELAAGTVMNYTTTFRKSVETQQWLGFCDPTTFTARLERLTANVVGSQKPTAAAEEGAKKTTSARGKQTEQEKLETALYRMVENSSFDDFLSYLAPAAAAEFLHALDVYALDDSKRANARAVCQTKLEAARAKAASASKPRPRVVKKAA